MLKLHRLRSQIINQVSKERKMMNTKNLTDKLKTLAVGATLMAGIALGTGCDDAQKITPAPSEDVVNDNDENNDENPVDNNDTDNNTIENNDNDEKPINNDDKDDVIDDNDKDNQPNDNDKDDKDDSDVIDDNNKEDKDDSDVNDSDPIENNDNDNNPSENNDSDYTSDLNGLFDGEEMIITKSNLEKLTQAQIDDRKNNGHNEAKTRCPYNHVQQPERYDAKGNMYIVDKCEGNIEEPIWLENAAPKILFDRYDVPPPETQRVVSMTVDYLNKGSPSNMKIRVPYLILDVNFVSQSCLSRVNEATSIIEIGPDAHADNPSEGCYIDGEEKAPTMEAKATKQIRTMPNDYVSLCKTMPNYQLDKSDNACYTTIEEFVWLESVPHKILPKNSKGFLPGYSWGITSIRRDLDTNVFHMTMQFERETSNGMTVYVTLKNAKSCIEQCQGKEGCTSHIEPSQNASRGCIINGEEVKGEESAQHLKPKQHNLKPKTAPRFIKPAPAVAKQYYAKNLRPNRQKWLAQNVRNFGRNGR